MADSAFLSRLPVRGAVFEGSGPDDAYKVPLLGPDGKIDLSLMSKSATIYTAANTAGRLLLTAASPGDFCTQTDNNSIYFLKSSPPAVESNWVRLSTIQDSAQDFDSPNFTGIPTAPTANIANSSNQLATTAFVKNLTGTAIPEVNAPMGEVGDSVKFSREDHVHPTDTTRAPLANPQFTGSPTAPNPDYTDNNTRLATTAFVKQQSIDGFATSRGNVNLNNYRIVSLGMPIGDRDAATKGYVDAMQGGLTIREAVRAATTSVGGNISLAGAVTNVDGVALNNGDRVLVKNQTNAAQNGIYVVNLGGPWQRAADADSSLEMKNGVYVFVTSGTVNINSAWVLITSGNVVLNTSPINFTYYTRQDVDQVQAGNGLIRETNTLVIDPAVVATVTNLNTKQNTLISGTNIKTINNSSLLGSGDIAITKTTLGLGNVDNTSDLDKPVSTLTQTALNSKVDKVSGKQLSTEDFTSALKIKLDAIAAGAEVNVQANWTETNSTSDAFILNKPTLGTAASRNVGTGANDVASGTHIHAISDVTNLQTSLAGKENSITAGTTGQYWRGDKTWQTLDKTTIGLSNVDNTSDLSKPISTLMQTALNAKQDTLVSATNIKTVNGTSILGAGNITISTAATQVNANWTETNTSNAAFILNKPTLGTSASRNVGTGANDVAAGVHSHAITDVTNLQTSLAGKENSITAGTTGQYWRGDKTWQTLDKSAVSLSNVDNTSDASKPVSTATQTALNAKQDTLVSATNIKTVNGTSILGAGNIVISTSGTQVNANWTETNTGSTAFILNKPTLGTSASRNVGTGANDVAAGVHSHAITDVTNLQTSLAAKQDTLVSGTNIKTVNGASILGTGNIAIATSGLAVAANTGLNYTADTLSTAYNTTISDTVESIAVGGATVATAATWKTRNIVQVLDAILFPDVLPTYTSPTLILSGISATLLEIGESLSQQSLSLVGTKNDAGAFTNLSISRTSGGATVSIGSGITNPAATTTTNIPNQFGYVNPNNPNNNYSYTTTSVGAFTVTSGISTWRGAGNYSAGFAKKNNKGVDDARTPAIRSVNAPQASSTGFESNIISVTGIYPYYWGVSSTQPTAASIASAIQSGAASVNRVLADSNDTVSIAFGANGQFVWFAHAGTYTPKTKWYNTELNQGNIGAGNFILTPVDQNVTAQNGRWTGVSFKVYISSGATTTSGAIQFRNI